MNVPFTPLADGFYVAPQITPADVEKAKALGVRLIINNRPDGEETGQPENADIEAAAKAAGIAYVEILVSGMNIGAAHLDAFDAALSENDGPVLAFCRSGTRSTVLRSFARARAGGSAEEIIREASAAGYNIAGQRGVLIALGAREAD
ncbi:MAG: TIGR01244 family phosphatase [Parvularculaceae bacterium]|nr:TIGR01244 family phosphatase [Parvularculaceae bacterium]